MSFETLHRIGYLGTGGVDRYNSNLKPHDWPGAVIVDCDPPSALAEDAD